MVRFVSIYVGKFESHCPRARERPGLANIDGLLIRVNCEMFNGVSHTYTFVGAEDIDSGREKAHRMTRVLRHHIYGAKGIHNRRKCSFIVVVLVGEKLSI